MEIFSPYVVAGAAAWIIAHLLKFLIQSIKAGRLNNARVLFLSGGMPSSHTATAIALLIVIALKDGVGSGLFGVALLFGSVVVYDSLMVRRSSGEQGQSLTALIKEQKSKVRLPRVAMGHTPLEVLAGALLGVVIGVVVSYSTL